jgi:hypothetical protein
MHLMSVFGHWRTWSRQTRCQLYPQKRTFIGVRRIALRVQNYLVDWKL